MGIHPFIIIIIIIIIISQELPSSYSFFFFSFFFVLTRHDFFLDMIFIFFNNLGDCFFFGCLSLFCFNWLSFFNKSI